jgi:hypothetical protein
MEDIECQEYAAFSLAHLASNRDNQVKLVDMGVVRPLVAMLSSDAEPKHYAGLALLKLADNFENHMKIFEGGGIQALLRLGRTRSTDDQLQHKAALTLGQIASNAVKLLPAQKTGAEGGNTMGRTGASAMTSTARTMGATAGTAVEGELNATNPLIGTGSRVMQRLRSQVANAQKDAAKDMTIEYLDKSLAQTQQERFLQRSQSDRNDLQGLNNTAMKGTDNLAGAGAGVVGRGARAGAAEMSRSMDQGFVTPGQTLTRTALQIGSTMPPTPATVVQPHGAAGRRTDNLNATTKDF